MSCDILVVGASLGGVQAALKAAQNGYKVILTEETDWIGGQLTSQAVPPDEHKWIERTGATKGYMHFREQVRRHYRGLCNVTNEVRDCENLNPGRGWVSRLCHEPIVALKILRDSLQPYIENGSLQVLYFCSPVSAQMNGDEIKSVVFKKADKNIVISAKYYIDATDCGDVLPLVGAKYRTGAESCFLTGEFHAPKIANNEDMQPVTYVVALGLVDRSEFLDSYKIAKPLEYDFFEKQLIHGTKHKLLSWFMPSSGTEKSTEFRMYDSQLKSGSLGLWTYRRVISQLAYTDKVEEVSLINWSQNDYSFGNIFDSGHDEYHRNMARQQSLCLVYWLQNFAENEIGGLGYPVRLRGDVVGSEDGIAKSPYVRESRRIVALKTITEEDISKRTQSNIICFDDSIGVGQYPIDLHATTKTRTTLFEDTQPFEIPLSALIPIRIKNLIAGCKNIGTTHLTNGCFRLHPIEWNIGEVAGHLAAYCIETNCNPSEVVKSHMLSFQSKIENDGIQIHWDKEIIQK